MKVAFYALETGAWRDYITLLHIPYTLWHLSYVAIGAAVAPTLYPERLAYSLLAFFLAVGIGAHALDEMRGRPLRTRIPAWLLAALAAGSLAAAIGLGAVAAITITATILPFMLFGAFIVFAYNLELCGGRFHSPFWFALGWGAFPMLTAYWVNSQQFSPVVPVVAAFCFCTSLAQRYLSLQARFLRRRVSHLEGVIHFVDSSRRPLEPGFFLATPERALKFLSLSMVLLAAGLVTGRLAS